MTLSFSVRMPDGSGGEVGVVFNKSPRIVTDTTEDGCEDCA